MPRRCGHGLHIPGCRHSRGPSGGGARAYVPKYRPLPPLRTPRSYVSHTPVYTQEAMDALQAKIKERLAKDAERRAARLAGNDFVTDRIKPNDPTKRDIYYGPKGSQQHGHIVESGECEDISYSRLPNGQVEYDDRGGRQGR